MTMSLCVCRGDWDTHVTMKATTVPTKRQTIRRKFSCATHPG